jgi:hypothetical protein
MKFKFFGLLLIGMFLCSMVGSVHSVDNTTVYHEEEVWRYSSYHLNESMFFWFCDFGLIGDKYWTPDISYNLDGSVSYIVTIKHDFLPDDVKDGIWNNYTAYKYDKFGNVIENIYYVNHVKITK